MVEILGGYQTDFARHAGREGRGLFELIEEAARGALEDAGVEPGDVDAVHVGNFTGELFSGQGHLGAMALQAIGGLECGASRHEAACASGSVAALAALAAIEAKMARVALVVGVEAMRHVDGRTAADHLGAAAFRGREGQGARYLWPAQFSRIAGEVEERHGLERRHLVAIAEKNFDNARRNPKAQAREWSFDAGSFAADDARNPIIEGRIRKRDCAQITDGACAVVLAAPGVATRRDRVSRIAGWGHRSAGIELAPRLAAARPGEVLFPEVAAASRDARRRAGIDGPRDLAAIELHDCFTITEYVLYEHLDLCEPGGAGALLDEGATHPGGAVPVNPSGGLIGGGHPVGATGVRMLFDAHRQVTGTAGETQVEGSGPVQTLNIGGHAATTVSFVVRAA